MPRELRRTTFLEVLDRRPPLFDSDARTDARPKNHLETSHEFFNRIAGEYWDQVRDLMQVWIDRVPDDEGYRDLRGRLQADDADHYSAFLELYLHELLVRAGYHVQIHPTLPNSKRRPDFLVAGHGHSSYLEAIHPGPQPQARGRSQRRAAFLDSIQRCSNRNFFLSLDELVVGPGPAPGRRVRREIERWLARLDPDDITYNLDNRETYRWQADGWSAEFSAIPISREHRGRADHRPIGVYADGGVGSSTTPRPSNPRWTPRRPPTASWTSHWSLPWAHTYGTAIAGTRRTRSTAGPPSPGGRTTKAWCGTPRPGSQTASSERPPSGRMPPWRRCCM